jgi:hypothetical protein
LGALEAKGSAQAGYALYVLPGRYAFVLKATPAVVANLIAPK